MNKEPLSNRLRKWAAHHQERYDSCRSEFLKVAAISPASALGNHGAELLRCESVCMVTRGLVNYCDLLADGQVPYDLNLPPGLGPVAQMEMQLRVTLVRELGRMDSDMIEYHIWRHNSTCPIQNLLNQYRGMATGTLIIGLRDLLKD